MLLIRHAHIDTGPSPGRLCGTLDVPLSGRGHDQLRTMAAHWRNAVQRPDALYSSTLTRARDTAAVFARIWQLHLGMRASLAEIHCGRLEGLHLAEIEREYPDLWARNAAQQDDGFTWPDGESYGAFRRRVLSSLQALAVEHPGQTVAVVTHAGVISQVLGTIRSRPAAVWELDRPDPLSLTEVRWHSGAPDAVLTFNQREWW